MVHKLCPDCDSQVPVACKSCYCGYNFLKKKGPGKSEKEKTESVTPNSHISSDNIIGGSLKSRRTSRTKRERPDYYSASEYENQIRRLSRTSVSSEKSAAGVDLPSPRRRGRGRPPKHGNKRRTLKKQTVKPEPSKEEDKDEDVYVNIPPDKAFVYGVCLADINRKIQGQWNGPENSQNGMRNAMKRTRRTSDFAKS